MDKARNASYEVTTAPMREAADVSGPHSMAFCGRDVITAQGVTLFGRRTVEFTSMSKPEIMVDPPHMGNDRPRLSPR